jgi:hypothetical protein
MLDAATATSTKQSNQTVLTPRLHGPPPPPSAPLPPLLQDEERTRTLLRAQYRRWCEIHGKLMRPPKLSNYIRATVRMWFELVDDDGSGTLEHHELMGALQVGAGGAIGFRRCSAAC